MDSQVSFVRCYVSVEENVKRAGAVAPRQQSRSAGPPDGHSVLQHAQRSPHQHVGRRAQKKHAALAMAPRRAGSIVSVASVAGVLNGLSPHAYASNNAVVGLTKNAASLRQGTWPRLCSS
ncbi:hypothetical protein SETIT_4G287800v2 [Setaria italica]|uniref:Uncharacterized protein n=1 Tax=Setaria italica TaxID=4555 RepID=A0A368R173_SETIT|nr:hypothetical protein SETIT_4G287800v2 [Setaria italica]